MAPDVVATVDPAMVTTNCIAYSFAELSLKLAVGVPWSSWIPSLTTPSDLVLKPMEGTCLVPSLKGHDPLKSFKMNACPQKYLIIYWIMAPRSSIHHGSHGSTPGLPSRKEKASVLCNIVECRCNASKQTTFKCEYLMQHFSVAWEEKVISLFVLLQLFVKNKEKNLCQTAFSFTLPCLLPTFMFKCIYPVWCYHVSNSSILRRHF